MNFFGPTIVSESDEQSLIFHFDQGATFVSHCTRTNHLDQSCVMFSPTNATFWLQLKLTILLDLSYFVHVRQRTML